MSAAAVETVPDLLFEGAADPRCRACVAIPVRNEETTLQACLDALAAQVDLQGAAMDPACLEVLLLCNNCTDRSAEVARAWHRAHPQARLLIAERQFAPREAHAGTARRCVTEAAWHRLRESADSDSARGILCTDADSTVAPDWVAQNLQALARGADAVGGEIALTAEELEHLPAAVRHCYAQDRRYAALIAQIEDLLDPQEGDPWPRHLDHFGSSLACTPEAYARAGGMPAAAVLEDEAFVNRLRLAGLRLRHEPAVRVFTSARLKGRATTGLAGQFRLWSELPGHEHHLVQSAAFLKHRFQGLRQLREAFWTGDVASLPEEWRRRVKAAMHASTMPAFLRDVDCDRLLGETFRGARQQPIEAAITTLTEMLRQSGAAEALHAVETPTPVEHMVAV